MQINDYLAVRSTGSIVKIVNIINDIIHYKYLYSGVTNKNIYTRTIDDVTRRFKKLTKIEKLINGL